MNRTHAVQSFRQQLEVKAEEIQKVRAKESELREKLKKVRLRLLTSPSNDCIC